MMAPGVTPEIVAQKIRDARGNISAAAISLRVSRQALYRYIEKHASLRAVLSESRETMKDMVESVLYSKALEGESWAVCFFLKTQAKDRGYVERVEQTGADGEPQKIIVQYVNSPYSEP
jgi:fructose-specific phosphotransferase system component IIB